MSSAVADSYLNPAKQPTVIISQSTTANDRVAYAVPTVQIKVNSSIRAKVRQCLAILYPSSTPSVSNATTRPAPVDKKAKRGSKIVALEAAHPSAASKTITVAEIVKRCIQDDKQEGRKGLWWQFTKIESKLIDWPPPKNNKPRQENAITVEDEEKDDDDDDDDSEEGRKESTKPDQAAINANKRKQNGPEERAAKKPRLHSSNPQDAGESHRNPINISSSSTSKASSKIQQDAQDETPPHLQNLSNQVSGDGPIPPYSTTQRADEMEVEMEDDDDDDDEIPPHLRDTPPPATPPPQRRPQSASSVVSDGKPAHLRGTSPPQSDDVPPHLRDSTPIPANPKSEHQQQQWGYSSDEKPAHLQSSAPNTPFKAAAQPSHHSSHSRGPKSPPTNPIHTEKPDVNHKGSPAQKPQPKSVSISSPSVPHHATVESDDESTTVKTSHVQANKAEDESEEEDDDDEYRRFTQLDLERVSEKHTKRLLNELDEAERNRKKYRAIALMTIYLSLEKRSDLEKLHGCQTNKV
ncbi:hypothetical protein TWF694_001668 [Orbilia ellipsospora]|uniref:Uncharacterized protein n=1 Tax=Orbilia ellipsospora TaxID=2528407 RepID=A0AAV9X4N8_9PEZI